MMSSTTINNMKEQIVQSSKKSKLPLKDPKRMQVIFYLMSTGQMTCPEEESYNVLRCSILSEYEHLPLLCSSLFAKPFITSQLFDIFDLFHRAHFKSSMWYTVINYIAVHLKDLSTREEYLAMPYSGIRPRCTTLFRYLPAFLEKEDHLLDYIIRWGRYAYDSRKKSISRLLELIHIREVSGSFAKSLVCKLFDVADVGYEKTNCLRTFVRMENRSRHFCFEYQMHNRERMHYVNSRVCSEPIINSNFAIKDDVIFNLQSTYTSQDAAGWSKERYTFRCAPIESYENLTRSDENARRITNYLKSPTFSASPQTLDMVTTSAKVNNEIYVYLSLERKVKQLHEQLHFYNCERDEWHQLVPRSKKLYEALFQSRLISGEHGIYLVGGSTKKSTIKGSLFMLDVREGAFNKLPKMKLARSSLGACVFDGQIYAAGGLRDKDEEYTNAVEVFDLTAGKWRSVAPMMKKRQNFKLVPFGNELWALGNKYATVETYDRRTDSWSLTEHSLIDALGNPIIKSMLRPEPPFHCYNIEVLDALVF